MVKTRRFIFVYSIVLIIVNSIVANGAGFAVNPVFMDFMLLSGNTEKRVLILSNLGLDSIDWFLTEQTSPILIKAEPLVAFPEIPAPAKDLEINWSAEYSPDVVLVCFHPRTSISMRKAIHEELKCDKKASCSLAPLDIVEIPKNGDVRGICELYNTRSEVAYAEPNYIYRISDFPNDPSFSNLWGLHNTGQTGGTDDADIDVPEAWELQVGSREIIVGVIDTGIDYHHEDLVENLWTNSPELNGEAGVDDDGNGIIDDIFGARWTNGNGLPTNGDPFDGHRHGTHVSGTIGALGNNGIGVVGVNHAVRLMGLKFLSDGGSGSTADAIAAIEYAVAMGAHVTSNSWGGGGFSSALRDIIAAAGSAGQLFVAAAGNNGQNADTSPMYPAAYDVETILSVAASDHNDAKAGFSNWGLESVDLAAPGVNTLSTIPGNRYSTLSGTSMATPHVAGVVALMLANTYPNLPDALQLKEWILNGVDPVNAFRKDGPTPVLTGGRLNAASSLALAGVSWLTQDPSSGTLDAGRKTKVVITVDATDLNGGDSQANLILNNTNPDASEIVIPISLHVTGIPDIAVLEESLDFGPVFINGPRTLPLIISNDGTDLLTINSLSADVDNFMADPARFTLNPKESKEVAIIFSPEEERISKGVLTIASNDPDEEMVEIVLIGEGVRPPRISVRPKILEENLFTGETLTKRVQIVNTGVSDLNFAISIKNGLPNAGALRLRDWSNSDNVQEHRLSRFQSDSVAENLDSLESHSNVLVLPSSNPGIAVEDPRILIIQDTSAWGLEMNAFILDEFGMASTVINSSQIASTEFREFDIIITVGDESATYYDAVSEHVTKFEDFVSQGGILQYQLATQDGVNVKLAGDVDMIYGNLERFNTVELPDHALVEGLPFELEGNWANHCYLENFPENAAVVTRTRDTDLPTTVEYTLGRGTVVATGMTWEFLFPRGYNSGPMLGKAFAYSLFLAEQARWLSVTPTSRTVPRKKVVEVELNFDATGLNGGEYTAAVFITSNDPVTPEVIIPVTIHVTGAPDITISPDILDFDTVFLGQSATKILTITNEGTDLLTIDKVVSDHGDYKTDRSSFVLAPGEREEVTVTFTPNLEGERLGNVTILSNDKDESLVNVAVAGFGLLPPKISVRPKVLEEDLLTGETLTKRMQIVNTGVSDLNFAISIKNGLPDAGALRLAGWPNSDSVQEPGVSGFRGDWAAEESNSLEFHRNARVLPNSNSGIAANDPEILIIQDTSAWGLEMNAFIMDEFGMASTVINSSQIVSTDFREFDIIITVGNENAAYYDAVSGHVTKFEDFVFQGGILQYQLATHNGVNVKLAGEVDMTYGNFERFNTVELPDHALVKGLPLELEGNWANHCYLENFPEDAEVVTRTRDTDLPTTVEYTLGRGTVIATGMTWEFLFPRGYNSGPMLGKAFAYSLFLAEQARWLSVTPTSRTVPRKEIVEVELNFDATGLNGGDYTAAVFITSNDPVTPEVIIPVTIHVTGAPDIAISPDVLDFGTVFVGQSATALLTITNKGTDLLEVNEVASHHGDYELDVSDFSLKPGENQEVKVTFEPIEEDISKGSLTIVSNDPDQPKINLLLVGQGLIPPEITVAPERIKDGLITGETSTHRVKISNRGGSILNFDVSVRAGDAALGSKTSLSRRHLTATKRYPSETFSVAQEPFRSVFVEGASIIDKRTLNDTEALSGSIDVAGEYSGEFLHFGITEYGEIMPFQFPVGIEHLQIGAYISGYTLVYHDGGGDRIAYASFKTRSNIESVSYTEFVNNDHHVVVEVITETMDRVLQIVRTFTFRKKEKFIHISTQMHNISDRELEDVIFKSFADWDVDSDYSDDDWDYDRARNMVYASDTVYTAIASQEPPDLMDIYGWDDYSRRETDVDFPTGPVIHHDGLEILHFELGDFRPGGGNEIVTVYATGSDLSDLQSVVDRGVVIGNWLSVGPPSGTVLPGESIPLEVTLDATGLHGGDYTANVFINSNDPVIPEVIIPVTIHVTGTPDISISPDVLDFDAVFLGQSATRILTITNEGTDPLRIDKVTSDHKDYRTDVSSLVLAPGEREEVGVTFTPNLEGKRLGNVTILSNDKDESLVNVAVAGLGLLPPKISVRPKVLEEDLFTGETLTKRMQIANTGVSDLNFAISIKNGLPDAGTFRLADWSNSDDVQGHRLSGLRRDLAAEESNSLESHSNARVLPNLNPEIAANDPKILIIQDTSAWGLEMNAFIMDEFGMASTVINSSQIASTDFHEFDIIITVGNENAAYYDAVSGHVTKFEDFVFQGGILQYQLATHNGVNVKLAGEVDMIYGNLERFNTVELPDHALVEGLPFDLEGNWANHCYLENFPEDAVVITRTKDTDLPTTVEYSLGRGTVVATGMTWEFLFPRGYNSGPMLVKAFAYSLFLAEQARWLSLAPASGTIPRKNVVNIELNLDATDLDGGDYTATLLITSNDPVTPEVILPVTIHVTDVLSTSGSKHVMDQVDSFGKSLAVTDNANTWKRKSARSAPVSFLSQTVYEDGEDGNIHGWNMYGNGSVANVVDASGNRIISTEATLVANPFRLGLKDKSDWNNTEEFSAYFAILMEEDVAVYFGVDTSDGERFLCYTPGPEMMVVDDDVICFGLGFEPDGHWHAITRNLADDLEQALPGATLNSVKDFYVFGNLKLDDLILRKQSTD